MKEITIETKIELKDYLNLVFILTIRRKIIQILILLAFILLIWGLLSFFGICYEFGVLTYIQLFLSLFILICMPVIYKIRARNFYISNERLKEKITYTFTNSQIIIKGDSFSSEMTWEKTYKVVEFKNWVLVYQNRIHMNAIPKNAFNMDTLAIFREIVGKKGIIIKKFR